MDEAQPRLEQVERRPEEVRTPGRPLPGAQRILVVRHDALGDVILSLPALCALRTTYPEARTALMVAPPHVELGGLLDGVDVLPSSDDRRELLERMRAFAPDAVVCISRDVRHAWAAVRAGARFRVGPGHRYYSPLFARQVREHRRAGERHELEYALSFAHRAGAVAGPAEFGLHVPAAESSKIETFLREHGIDGSFVLMHPGSGGSCPRWPVEHFEDLAQRLAAAGVAVALSIGPADGELRNGFDGVPCRFEGGLGALAALSQRASLVVSNSTGPLHLAAALDTPTVALHAPWATCGVSRWGPYSGSGWAIVAHHPQAVDWGRDERRRNAATLMAAVEPETVLTCCLALLAGETPRV
ncbi:MAG: glycosyltransferase family 9 protein [bacterium]|nr:glycosyltransferase family 9 protein [bacterium]